MYRNKCATCGKTWSKSPYVRSAGEDFNCRKCYAKLRRETSKNPLGESLAVSSSEAEKLPEVVLPAPPSNTSDKEFLKVTGEKYADEVTRLQEAIQHHCGKQKHQPIYQPTEFYNFCCKAGAANLFNFILSCMTSSRHSEERILLNRKRTVVILYQLCFGLSQKCNFFQEDNGLFLTFCNLTQSGLETQRQLGTSCSSKVITRNRATIAKENLTLSNEAIKEAMDKKYAILLMIDDYHNIHTIRRPTDEEATSKADHMCTIIIKIIKEAPAIPFNLVNLVQNPRGIDIDLLVNNLCSAQFFGKVSSCSFASSMPQLTCQAFDPLMGRHQMEAHDYQAQDARSLRSFKDVYLIDFIESPLKSKKDYEHALNIVLQSSMREYLSKFVVLMPADWPGQYFPRQLVYQKASQATAASNISQGSCRHPLTSVIPTLGPLHVDLNADEDIVVEFMPFMRLVYESVFPGRKLADKPKPWRIQFLLELIYGGWTLVRTVVKTVFCQVKDVQYGVLLNILDNYIPLTLCSYSILFKLNHFDDYFCSIFRLWIMFFCFHRKNYNKAPLFWLSNILFWKTQGCKDVYNFFCSYLNVIDEYFVEFVHSLARKSTNPSDTPEQLREKLFSLFAAGERQTNFRAAFTPHKNYVFSRRQLTSLFSRVASIIVSILNSIVNAPGAAHPLPRAPRQRRDVCLWSVPALFGDKPMKTDVMPLGFQFCPHPDQGKRCDLANCTISIDTPWKMFEGCWHSFHISCLDVVDVCPICRKGIENAMRSLSAVANKSVHAQGNAGDTDANDGSGGVEGAAENDDAGVEEPLTSSTDENVDQVLQSLTLKIMAFPVRPPPVQPLSSVRSCTSPQPQTSQPTSSTRSNTSSQPPTSSTSSSTSSQPPTSSTRSNTSSQPPTSSTSSSTSSQPTPSQPSSQRRPPHCGTCGHIQQGHHRLVSCETLGKSCPVCPSRLCSREGHAIPCVCQWCTSHSQTNICVSNFSLSQGPNVVQETHFSANVTEWLISVSQSTVTSDQMGSNACTIIAVYGAVNFLSSNRSLPSPANLPEEFISDFKQFMIYGNQSYNWLGNQQPTYSAPEIISHPQLGFSGVVKCGDEYQFNSFSLFADELQHLVARPNHTKLAAVLILPPDKSMLLLIGVNAISPLQTGYKGKCAGKVHIV
ncbi:uncharacterized protein LOC144650903 isoform X2 [Oculina patagonica]